MGYPVADRQLELRPSGEQSRLVRRHACASKDTEALGVYVDSAAVLATFGRRVRELRVWRGLSQDALGRLSSLHRTAIHKFEKGGTDPRLTSIRRIARGLGVPPRALIEDDAEHPQRVADET
jgi:DNA-binding XRE family transcriptional regulator